MAVLCYRSLVFALGLGPNLVDPVIDLELSLEWKGLVQLKKLKEVERLPRW